ncbi:MAG: response regulator [Chryseolinea sp.]
MKRIINIFLVEADVLDQMEVRKTLDKRGVLYHMRASKNGEEALSLLDKLHTKPDIMLVDIHLPLMSGFEVAEKIRTDAAYNSMKIFVLTSTYDESDVRTAEHIGISGLIQKPLRLETSSSKDAFKLMIDLMNV